MVWGLTVPVISSTLKPSISLTRCWNCFTAAVVVVPYTPSSAPDFIRPSTISLRWTERMSFLDEFLSTVSLSAGLAVTSGVGEGVGLVWSVP